jgi:hypothetical protein
VRCTITVGTTSLGTPTDGGSLRAPVEQETVTLLGGPPRDGLRPNFHSDNRTSAPLQGLQGSMVFWGASTGYVAFDP